MKLHELTSSGHKGKKRLGRGGKRGTTSGRGTKGQRSRAGRRIRPAFRDLLIRLPKRRGFRNKPKSDKPFVVQLGDLMRAVKKAGGAQVAVDTTFLKSAKLVPMKHRGEIKVLGKSEEGAAAFVLKGIKASESVKAAIEKAGGKMIL